MATENKTPNKDIDKAMKKLLKQIAEDPQAALSPDEMKAKASVLGVAMKWEQIKHQIKDEGDFNPEAL